MARPRRFWFRPWAVQVVHPEGGRPRARSGHRVVCDSKALVSLGGYNPQYRPEDHLYQHPHPDTWSFTKPVFRELWQFSLARRTWKPLTDVDVERLPDQLASSAATRLGSTMMVFGGTGSPFGHQCSNTLYAYDLNGKNGFTAVQTQGQPPLPQYGQAIICSQGYLYVIGGTDGLLYSIDVHRLDLQTRTWQTIFTCTGNRTDEPEARYRHELAFDGSNLYVLAGGTAEFSFDFVNIPTFNLETFTWSFKKSKKDLRKGYPIPRKCHSAVQINKEDGIDVFIMGGFDNRKIFNDLWRLEIPSFQWTLMKKSFFPNPLYFHSSAITPEGCMYTFGGIQLGRDSTTRSNKLYKLWLCIPKLSEICWESLLYYFPHMVGEEKSKLLNCGIPLRFVERLDE